MTKVAESLRALLTDLIDYAGLFPPAALDMKPAVEKYARYLDGEYAWMLGRLVVPASRLSELEQAMPANELAPWRLSVLLGPKLEDDVTALQAFAPRCSKLAVIDCIETRVASTDDIVKVHQLVGPATTTHYEVPLTTDLPKLLDAMAAVDGRAKIRTGGVTADAIPSTDAVANFLLECAKRDLPFKATAGLHHPMRCPKPLTYEPNAPVAVMHGFLNVFIAATAAWASGKTLTCGHDWKTPSGKGTMRGPFPFRMDESDVSQIRRFIQAASPFEFQDDGMRGPTLLPKGIIEQARRNFAISFGSCSFEEPIEDLKALNLL